MSGYYEKADEATEAFLRQAAKDEGLPYRVWCKKYGIVDAAALHRIADNEVSLEALRDDGVMSRFVSAEEWTRAYKGDSRGVTSRENCVSPKRARRRPSVGGPADAAAE